MPRILPFRPKTVDIAVVQEEHRVGSRACDIWHGRCTINEIILENGGVEAEPVVCFYEGEMETHE